MEAKDGQTVSKDIDTGSFTSFHHTRVLIAGLQEKEMNDLSIDQN